jgi:hypothetical protein
MGLTAEARYEREVTPWARTCAAVVELADQGVVGSTVAWTDNNGIAWSRTVPTRRLPSGPACGMGVTYENSVR